MAKNTRKENVMQYRPRLMELLLHKQAQLKREISVAEIAEAVDLSKQTIYDWKSGKQLDSLDSDTAYALCQYFGVQLSDLVEFVKRQPKT